MERIDEDLAAQLMLSEPRIARLTEPLIAEALDGFELDPVRPMQWIARAIQGAIYCTLKHIDDEPDRQSNSDTRDELAALASRAETLWLDLSKRSSPADSALFYTAFSRWDGAGGIEVDGVTIGEPAEYAALVSDSHYLERLARILRLSADGLASQKGPWRDAERREKRIERAQFLSPVFERAYGREPTVNERPLANSLGPWADFYSRIVSVAFSRHETSNLRDVLKEARRRDKKFRVEFAPGIIPE